MPADSSSKLHTILYVGSNTYGNLVSPIPTSGSLAVNSGLVEISPTSGNVYAITYITTGNSSFSLTQGSSVFSYTHGATKLIQPGGCFY